MNQAVERRALVHGGDVLARVFAVVAQMRVGHDAAEKIRVTVHAGERDGPVKLGLKAGLYGFHGDGSFRTGDQRWSPIYLSTLNCASSQRP